MWEKSVNIKEIARWDNVLVVKVLEKSWNQELKSDSLREESLVKSLSAFRERNDTLIRELIARDRSRWA